MVANEVRLAVALPVVVIFPGFVHVMVPAALLSAPVPASIAAVVTVNVFAVLPQRLLATTAMSPLCAPGFAVALIEVVPCPELIIHPVGRVQV